MTAARLSARRDLTAALIVCTALSAFVRPQLAAARANPIVLENSRAGTTAWELTKPAGPHMIEGYASATSVAPGQTVQFSVSSATASYDAAIYRIGWYQGKGGRLLTSFAGLPGHQYAVPPPDPQTGLIVCRWPVAFSLTIPATWVTGVYMVKLTNTRGFQSYIPFVVRSNQPSDFLFVHSIATDEAYNVWGGKSLYLDSSYSDPTAAAAHRAYKVSFARPFSQYYGAGDFFFWEYQMVRWLERSGYDVSYITDLDEHERPSELLRHHAVLIAGHDEYWSRQMRSALEAAVAQGVNLGVFAGNTGYWQVRFEPLDGVPDRVEVCFKDASRDPLQTADPRLVTVRWEDPPLDDPESRLLGAMYRGFLTNGTSYPLVVKATSSWVFQGTGARTGLRIAGIVGPEYDGVARGDQHPPHLVTLTASPVRDHAGRRQMANATIYTAPSGATVFDGSTIQWSWGLDDFTPPFEGDLFIHAGSANPVLQRMSANILRHFLAAPLSPGRSGDHRSSVRGTGAARDGKYTKEVLTAIGPPSTMAVPRNSARERI